ncbi:MAG TPA: TetR/AcrR family transcriptional regulator [Bacillota bacterium]|nr:TetR/AcrR family transcriptional regulator [Bacillota bacterium]
MAGQSEKKLKKLLEKSEELFWKYGYDTVSMNQIASEAGISKMTIYKHFHSKEDLFIEVLTNSIEVHINNIMKTISQEYHTIEKIGFLYNYSLDLLKKYPIILFRDIAKRKNILERIISIKQEKTLPIWRRILEDGLNKKEIRKMDIDFVSELLMNLPSAMKNMDFLYDEGKQLKLYESFFDFIKYGMLGSKE